MGLLGNHLGWGHLNQGPGSGPPRPSNTHCSNYCTHSPTCVAKCRWKSPSFLAHSWIVTKTANMMVGKNCRGRSQDPIQDTRLHLPLCVWHLGPGTSSTFSKSQGGVLIWRAWSCRGVVHIFNTNQSSTSSSGLHSFQHLATSTSAASPGKAASESERQDRRQLWDVAGDRSIRWSLGYLTLVLCQISEWYNP